MSLDRLNLSEDEVRVAEILTLAEVAEILRVSVPTVRKMAKDGELPGTLPPLGNRYFVSKIGLFEWLATRGESNGR